MNVIRHHHPGVQQVVATCALANQIGHYPSDGRHSQIGGSGECLVQQAVHFITQYH